MRLKEQAKRTKDAIVETLKAHGANNILVIHRGKHPAVEFNLNGRSGFIPFTLTPTDKRAILNQITLTKRVIRGMAAGHSS